MVTLFGKGERWGNCWGRDTEKKDYLLSSGRKDTKKPPDITKNNGNNSTSTVSTAVLAWLSHFIQRLHLYPATRILIHSLIISCLDYCNNVCAKLFFFLPTHYKTIPTRASLLALFLTEVSLLFTYFFPHCYSPTCVQLHMKSRSELQCMTAIIQESQKQQTPTF